MCMDKRHILALKKVVDFLRPHSSVEIGSFSGCSATALSDVPEPHFVDICKMDSLAKVLDGIPQSQFHLERGEDFLRRTAGTPYDLVFVDGGHDLPTVSGEIAAILASPPRVVAAHDVNATVVGHEACEGAKYLREKLVAEGWSCYWDQEYREGEYTERGFFLATRDPEIAPLLAEALRVTCG